MRRRTAPLALVVFGVALSRALARPRSFWELDDYIFGLSLHVFAPQASVPQPPFFPGFVYLGRFVRLFVPDDAAALTGLSVVASCSSVLLVYAIARRLLEGRGPALAASVLFAFCPASWFYAGIPASDSAGLAATLLTIWLSLEPARRPHRLLLAAAVFGIAFAIRAQTTVIAVVPLALAIARVPLRRAISAILCLIASVLLFWALPVLLAAHGWGPVIEALARHARYVATSTAVSGARPGLRLLAYRWLVAPFVGAAYAVAVGLLTAVGLFLAERKVRRRLLLLGFATLPYAAVALLLLDCTFSGRYFLPIVPFLAISTAAGAGALERRIPAALPAVTAGLTVWAAILLVPAIRTMHEQRAPAEVAAEAVRKLAKGRPTAVLYPDELRVQAELLFPGARRFAAEKTGQAALERAGMEVWRFGVGSINDPSAACWPARKPFLTIGRGRYLVVPYGRWDPRSPDFAEGWFGEETEVSAGCAPEVFRWMGSEGRVRFSAGDNGAALELWLDVPLRFLRRPPDIQLEWNGRPLTRFVPDSERVRRTLPLPAGSSSGGGPDVLTLRTSETFVPAERGVGDMRRLGLQVRRLRLVPRDRSSLRSSEPLSEAKG